MTEDWYGAMVALLAAIPMVALSGWMTAPWWVAPLSLLTAALLSFAVGHVRAVRQHNDFYGK